MEKTRTEEISFRHGQCQYDRPTYKWRTRMRLVYYVHAEVSTCSRTNGGHIIKRSTSDLISNRRYCKKNQISDFTQHVRT